MDAATRAELFDIAWEGDEKVQVQRLSKMVMDRIGPSVRDTNISGETDKTTDFAPHTPDGGNTKLPSGDREQYADNRFIRISEEVTSVQPQTGDGPPDLSNIKELASQGKIDEAATALKQMHSVEILRFAEAQDAIPILESLVDHDDYGKWARELLYDFLSRPDAREIAGDLDSPTIQAMIKDTMTGESPSVFQGTGPMQDMPTEELIQSLGDSNPMNWRAAMDELHIRGNDVVTELQTHRSTSDGIQKERIDQVLEWHFRGESPWDTEDADTLSHLSWDRDPYGVEDVSSLQSDSTPEISTDFAFNPDDVIKSLKDAETSTGTLGMITQLGPSLAKPLLCEILVRV
jgi:hypothetical protein